MTGNLVLMYHGIGEPAAFGEAYYTVKEAAFEAQLDLLMRERRIVSYPTMLAGVAPAGSVVLTFDDGERSVVTKALPLMSQRGVVGTLFVTTDWIGRAGYVDADDLRQLAQAGWTIGAHGATHLYLSDLGDAQLAAELARSRDELIQLLGTPTIHMSLPGGRVDCRVIAAIQQAGFQSLGTSAVGLNPSPPEACYIRRVMVLRSWSLATFQSVVAGATYVHHLFRARQQVLELFKCLLGNARYDRFRTRAFKIAAWLARSGESSRK